MHQRQLSVGTHMQVDENKPPRVLAVVILAGSRTTAEPSVYSTIHPSIDSPIHESIVVIVVVAVFVAV